MSDLMVNEPASSTVPAPTTIPGNRGGTLTPFNADRARELSLKRWEKFRVAASQAVTATAGVETKYQAWAKVVIAQTDKALMGDTRAAQFVAKAMDAFPDKQQAVAAGGSGAGLSINIAPELARELLERLAGVLADRAEDNE